mgnify:CR=1 FL=1
MSRRLTVGELRKALLCLPDDMPVLGAGGFDHSYRTYRGTTVLRVATDGRQFFWETDDRANTEDIIEALVLAP